MIYCMVDFMVFGVDGIAYGLYDMVLFGLI